MAVLLVIVIILDVIFVKIVDGEMMSEKKKFQRRFVRKRRRVVFLGTNIVDLNYCPFWQKTGNIKK